MKIIVAQPPNIEALRAAFQLERGVIFCWGGDIYNPDEVEITPWLRAHESVHSQRQGAAPEAWWAKYVADPEFRLREELPAHRAELGVFRDLGRKNNWDLRKAVDNLAGRLSSPIYGGIISRAEARRLLLA